MQYRAVVGGGLSTYYQIELKGRFEIWLKYFTNEKKRFYHAVCIQIWQNEFWSKYEQVSTQFLNLDYSYLSNKRVG